jgi:hypothetical protein
MTYRATGSYTYERLIALEDSHKQLIECLNVIKQAAQKKEWNDALDLLFVASSHAVSEAIKIREEAGI